MAERQDKVLIVDDNVELTRVLARLAGEAGILPIILSDGLRVVDTAVAEQPDVIVLDLALPHADGRDLLRALKAHPKTFYIPIFVHTGRDTHTDRIATLELGADDYLEKPFDGVMLIHRVQHRIRELREASTDPIRDVDRRTSEKLRLDRQERKSSGRIRAATAASRRPVLVVEDDRDVRQCILDVLEDEGIDALSARNGQEALALLKGHALQPSMILLDMVMPVMDGRALYDALSRDATLPKVPVVMMSEVAPGPEFGAVAWLQKPIRLDDLLDVVARTFSKGIERAAGG